MTERSSFLFARPSFTEGMARVLDIGCTLQEYNTSVTPEEADALALSQDVAAIGDDMFAAIATLKAEYEALTDDAAE